MRDAAKIRERGLAIIMAAVLALLTPVTYAVVKNVTVVDSNGNALGNTKVTIVFPDGTEQEEETDDKGMLIFDFPGDGEYKLVYPGGSMGVSVGGGVPVWAWVLGGAAAAGGVAVALDDDDDSNSSGSGGSDPGSGSGACVTGMYSVTTSVESNPDMHPANEFDGTWEVFCNASDTNVVQISGNAAAGFTCSPGNTCNDSGALCSIGGFTTTCSIMSTFGTGGWSGTLSGGDDGALPDTNMNMSNEPVLVLFNGTLL